MSKNETIDMYDVARIFNLSIEGVRKYKRQGLFEACRRVGRKDFYNMQEILSKKDLIESYKKDGFSLNKIEEKINELKLKQSLQKNLDNSHGIKKVLIVEDEESVITLLKDTLKRYFKKDEIKIFDTKRGRLGIEIAEIIRPDLIILDMALPDISGEEVRERLKNNPNTSQIKFIILSGVVQVDHIKEVSFQKPISISDFIAEVKKLLGIKTNLLVE